MHDCIDLGSAPAMEACAQVGSEDYVFRAQRECRAYIAQIAERTRKSRKAPGFPATLWLWQHEYRNVVAVMG